MQPKKFGKNLAKGTLLLAASALFQAPAHAGLIGDVVELSVSGLTLTTPGSALVGGGIEFQGVRNPQFLWEVDFMGSDGLTVQINAEITEGSFAGFREVFDFSNLDVSVGTITGVSILSSDLGGPGDPLPAFITNLTGNSFTFDTNNHSACAFGKGCGVGTVIETTLQIEVPGPGSLAILGLGLLGLGIPRRRRV